MLSKFVTPQDNLAKIEDLEQKVDYLLEQLKILKNTDIKPNFITSYSATTHTISAEGIGTGSIPLLNFSGQANKKGFVIVNAIFNTDTAHNIMASLSFSSNLQLNTFNLTAGNTPITLCIEINLGENLIGNLNILAGEADVKVSNISVLVIGENVIETST